MPQISGIDFQDQLTKIKHDKIVSIKTSLINAMEKEIFLLRVSFLLLINFYFIFPLFFTAPTVHNWHGPCQPGSRSWSAPTRLRQMTLLTVGQISYPLIKIFVSYQLSVLLRKLYQMSDRQND